MTKQKLDGDRSSLPKTLKTSEVKTYNLKRKSRTLSILILDAERLEQGLIQTEKFFKAIDTPECETCREPLSNHDISYKETKCNSCRKKEKNERIKKEMDIKWFNLATELGKLWQGYSYKRCDEKITRQHLLNDQTTIKFDIYRDQMFSGSGYHSYSKGHALRITSDKFDVEANRLKKDFGRKNLAEGLHKRIEKMIFDENEKIRRRKRRSQTNEQLITEIKDELNVVESDMNSVFSRMGKRSIVSNLKEVRYGVLHLNARKDSVKETVVYSVKQLNKSLTAEQVKKLKKLVDSF